nr:replication protein [Streptococcus hyovaginalis]
MGISRNTAYNYLNDVTFRRIYRERRNEMLKRTTTMLQSASIEAVKVLQEIMLDESVSPYARQQSAQTILSMAYKANEQTEILEMIEELEIKMKVLES